MKKQVKREEIISAAQKLIIQKGYRKTSVEDITKEAGIAKGSFYTYFKSKDSLMESIFSEKIEVLSKGLEDSLKNVQGLDDTIKKYIRYYLSVSENEAEFILVMMTMMRSIDSIGDVLIKRIEKDKTEKKEEIEEILKKYKDEIDIKDENDIERYSLITRGNLNNFYINNYFPSGNRLNEISIEGLQERIRSVDIEYETDFMSKAILKLIKK